MAYFGLTIYDPTWAILSGMTSIKGYDIKPQHPRHVEMVSDGAERITRVLLYGQWTWYHGEPFGVRAHDPTSFILFDFMPDEDVNRSVAGRALVHLCEVAISVYCRNAAKVAISTLDTVGPLPPPLIAICIGYLF